MSKACIYTKSSNNVPNLNSGTMWILLGLLRKLKFSNNWMSNKQYVVFSNTPGNGAKPSPFSPVKSRGLHGHIMLNIIKRSSSHPRMQLLFMCPLHEEIIFAEQRDQPVLGIYQSMSPHSTRDSHYHGYHGASRAVAINEGYR